MGDARQYRRLYDKALIERMNADKELSYLGDYVQVPPRAPMRTLFAVAFEIHHNVMLLMLLYLLVVDFRRELRWTRRLALVLPYAAAAPLAVKPETLLRAGLWPQAALQFALLHTIYALLLPMVKWMFAHVPVLWLKALLAATGVFYLCFFRYSYFVEEPLRGQLNTGTFLPLGQMLVLELLPLLGLPDGLLFFAVSNLLLVWAAPARRFMAHKLPLIYYPLATVFFCHLVLRLKRISRFCFWLSLFSAGTWLVAAPACFALLQPARRRISGPFVMVKTPNYSFETLHLLIERIEALKRKFPA